MNAGVRDRDEWLFDILMALEAIDATAAVPTFLEQVVQAYNLKTAAYLGVGVSGPADREPIVAVTYPSEWVSHYREHEYQHIDPAIQIGMRRLLPIDWSEFELDNRQVKELFGEASEFGLGKHGLSVPVHAQAGARGLFSVTSNMPRQDWSRLRQFHMRDFQVLATHLHALVLRLEGHDLTETLLSRRERECLQWIAEGKTVWECATILGLAGSTARCYLESVRDKLNATNNTHAVSKALTAGLLVKRL